MTMPGVTRSNGYPAYLARLIARGQLLTVPLPSGWTASHTGSGATGVEATLRYVSSGPTGSSVGLVYNYICYGLSHGLTVRNQINWDKDLSFFFGICRPANGDANTIGRLQLKSAITEGALAAKGIGIQISNLTLVGESYGTGLATTGSQVLAADREYLIEIRHTAGVKIEWFVDGVLLGTQSTVANIPSGASGNDAAMVLSIINGATAASRDLYLTGGCNIWQER